MYRIIILLLLAAIAAGCSTHAASPLNREFALESLYPFGDNEFRTYASLLLSLKDRKWKVKQLDTKKRVFEAKYCHKVSTDCLTIRGSIGNDWKINFRVIENTFDNRHVYRFIDNLQRSYQKYSNLSNSLMTEKAGRTVYWETIKDLKR